MGLLVPCPYTIDGRHEPSALHPLTMIAQVIVCRLCRVRL